MAILCYLMQIPTVETICMFLQLFHHDPDKLCPLAVGIPHAELNELSLGTGETLVERLWIGSQRTIREKNRST